MRETLSYLHIPETRTVCYIYETTIVIKIVMYFCSQKELTRVMSYYFPSSRFDRDYVLYKNAM